MGDTTCHGPVDEVHSATGVDDGVSAAKPAASPPTSHGSSHRSGQHELHEATSANATGTAGSGFNNNTPASSGHSSHSSSSQGTRTPSKQDAPSPPRTVPISALYRYARCGVDTLLFVGAVSTALVAGACFPIFSIVIGDAINSINAASNFMSTINRLSLYFALLAVGVALATWCFNACGQLLAQRVVRRLRIAYMDALLRKPIPFFDSHSSGELGTALAEDTESIQAALGERVNNVAYSFSTFVAGMVVGFLRSWKLSLVIVGFLPFLAIAAGVMKCLLSKLEAAGQDAYADANNAALEAFGNLRTVVAYGGEQHEARRYFFSLVKAEVAAIKKAVAIAGTAGWLMFLALAAYAVCMYYGAQLVIDARNDNLACYDPSTSGCFGGGSVLQVLFAVLTAALALGQLAPALADIGKAQVAAAKMYGIIDAAAEDSEQSTFAQAAPASSVIPIAQPSRSQSPTRVPNQPTPVNHSLQSGVVASVGRLPPLALPAPRIDAPMPMTARNVHGMIEFGAVSFRYPTRPEQLVLQDVSFTIQPGEVVAFVGASGCGKSTILQLLLKFYRPEAGSIRIDDVDIEHIDSRVLRAAVGIVPQEPSLLPVSILENVLLGLAGTVEPGASPSGRVVAHQPNPMRPPTNAQQLRRTDSFLRRARARKLVSTARNIGHVTADDEAPLAIISKEDFDTSNLQWALSAADVSGFVARLPNAVNTIVGARGNQLSGGQQQRIAIARALIRKPRILLFDEGTSALDSQTEQRVMQALADFRPDPDAPRPTMILISHRLSTVIHADQIFVMDAGRVVERGTHTTLLSMPGGRYRALWAAQNGNQGMPAMNASVTAALPAPGHVRSEPRSPSILSPPRQSPQVSSSRASPALSSAITTTTSTDRGRSLPGPPSGSVASAATTMAMQSSAPGTTPSTSTSTSHPPPSASSIVGHEIGHLRRISSFRKLPRDASMEGYAIRPENRLGEFARNVAIAVSEALPVLQVIGTPGGIRLSDRFWSDSANTPAPRPLRGGVSGARRPPLGLRARTPSQVEVIDYAPPRLPRRQSRYRFWYDTSFNASDAAQNVSEVAPPLPQGQAGPPENAGPDNVVAPARGLRIESMLRGPRTRPSPTTAVSANTEAPGLPDDFDSSIGAITVEEPSAVVPPHANVPAPAMVVSPPHTALPVVGSPPHLAPSIDAALMEPNHLPAVPMRRFWAYQKQDVWTVFVAALVTCINACLMPAFALLLARMLRVLFLIDNSELLAKAAMYMGLYFMLAVVGGVSIFVQMVVFGQLGERLTRRLRAAAFASLLRQEVSFFDAPEASAPRLASRLATDAQLVRQAFGDRLSQLAQNAMSLVVALVISFTQSWRLSLVLLGTMPLLAVGAAFQGAIANLTQADVRENAKGSSAMVYDAVSSIRVVRAFNLGDVLLQRYDQVLGSIARRSMRTSILSGAAMGYAEFVFFGIYALTFYVGGRFIQDGLLDFEAMMTVFFTITLASSSAGRALGSAAEFRRAEAASRSVFALIDRRSNIDAWTSRGGIKLPDETSRTPAASSERNSPSSSTTTPAAGGVGPARVARAASDGGPPGDGAAVALTISPLHQNRVPGARRESPVRAVTANGVSPVQPRDEPPALIVRSGITFQGVFLTYPQRPETPALNGLDLFIQAGKTTAVVGPSGHGKSTLLVLLQRFYAFQSGSIAIDGTDIRNIDLPTLRGTMAYVTQDVALFAGTIGYNVTYGVTSSIKPSESTTAAEFGAPAGNPMRQMSDAPAASPKEPLGGRVVTASQRAFADDFVRSFPDGYNTKIGGSSGAQLSGGQRQRLGLARAFMRPQASIWLLDEVTSALDAQSEQAVQAALNGLRSMGGGQPPTVILVTHRLATARTADQIVVVQNGVVAEVGTHRELMSLGEGGAYYALATAQGVTE